MEVDNGEKRSAEQAASLFGTPEVESQRRNTEKKSNWKIITGVSFNENSYLSNQNQGDFGPPGSGSFIKMSFFFFRIRKL